MTLVDFIQLRLKNAERRIARNMKREKAVRDLTESLDELAMPPPSGDDLGIRRLPPTCSHAPENFYLRLALRDSILANAEMYTVDEMRVALLWLRGYSPRAIFNALGLTTATAYRRFAPVIRQLQEACRE